jgi:hypothetical protein
MATFPLILLIAAQILFVLAALNVPSTRVSLGWAGMACLVAIWLFFGHSVPIRP